MIRALADALALVREVILALRASEAIAVASAASLRCFAYTLDHKRGFLGTYFSEEPWPNSRLMSFFQISADSPAIWGELVSSFSYWLVSAISSFFINNEQGAGVCTS